MNNIKLTFLSIISSLLVAPAFAFFGLSGSSAEDCAQKGIDEWVYGGGECLKAVTYNPIHQPSALVVFIHGDVSKGGPGDYLAKRMVRINPEANQFTAVAILRPGYMDSESNKSSGSDNGRRDHYTKHNISAVAEAIETLKEEYQPKATIVVGHSGGAAIAGVIAGMYPSLANGYVLGACPCDLVKWRKGRGRSVWRNSLSPSDYVASVNPETRIITISGEDDRNTSPALIESYVQLLKSRGIEVEHSMLRGVSHNGVARNEAFFESIEQLTRGQ